MGMQGDGGGGGRLEARTVETTAMPITRQSLMSVDDIFFRSGFGFRYGYGVRLSVSSLSGLSRRRSWRCRISTILFSRLSFSLFRLAV